jgi:hypothetical protein
MPIIDVFKSSTDAHAGDLYGYYKKKNKEEQHLPENHTVSTREKPV